MTVKELRRLLSAEKINIADENREITCGYAGDLLSHVMQYAPKNSCWLTVMTNVNVCAVATLADIAVVVICDGCRLIGSVQETAEEKGVNIIRTDLDIFSAAKVVSDALRK